MTTHPEEDALVSLKEVIEILDSQSENGKDFGFSEDDVHEIYSRIEKLPTTTPQRWISVEERLPEKGGEYICKDVRGVLPLDFFRGRWYDADGEYTFPGPTHWQPLPPPPTE